MGTARTMPAVAGAAGPTRLTWIPSGEFTLQSDAFYAEDRQVRLVAADDFWMDTRPATISDLHRFATASSYQSFAERPLRAARDRDRHPVAHIAHAAREGTCRKRVTARRHDHASAIPRPTPIGFRCVIRSGPLLARPGRRPARHQSASVQSYGLVRCRERLACAELAA